MKINRTTGELVIGLQQIKIGPCLTKDAFLESPLGRTSKRGVTNQGYASFSLALKDAPDEFGLSIVFKDQRIFLISIEVLDHTRSWGNWSEKNELRRRAAHDQLLAATLGNPPYRFTWGEVQSLYDPRSGASSITLRYSFPK